MSGTPLLDVRGLVKRFPVPRELPWEPRRSVHAVDGVNLSVERGGTFGLVGESGCGKTTLGRLILALEEADEGSVLFEGRDVFRMSGRELRRLRREVQVIFQDPFSSLDPRMTVRQILTEPFVIHGTLPDPAERAARIRKLLDVVGLARSHLDRYPHQFSGGQRQRVGIARALTLRPKLIVCDEPVSALDVSIQAQILNLLQDLQSEFELTYLFISHDFSVVRHLCGEVAVMYLGRIVETARTEELFEDPQHPYTEALLSAVPAPVVGSRRERVLLSGDVPSPVDPPPGCRFHPRCRYAAEECRRTDPKLSDVRPGRRTACLVRPFAEEASRAALRRKN